MHTGGRVRYARIVTRTRGSCGRISFPLAELDGKWRCAAARCAPAPGVNNGLPFHYACSPSRPVVDVSLSYRYPTVCNVSPIFHPRELTFFKEAFSLRRSPAEFVRFVELSTPREFPTSPGSLVYSDLATLLAPIRPSPPVSRPTQISGEGAK